MVVHKVLIALAACSCFTHSPSGNTDPFLSQNDEQKQSIELTSPAIQQGKMIPSAFTCDGKNISPALKWGKIPEEAASLALIADDHDAPGSTFVHWVIFNIPVDADGLSKNIPDRSKLKNGAIQRINGRKETGYTAPCPPSGKHRYFFKLYALDTDLDLGENATKNELLEAMQGRMVAKDELMGKYKRQ